MSLIPRWISTVETKVWAAVAGTGGGATVAAAVLWALGVFVWHAPSTADGAQAAVDSVPTPVAALVGLVVTLLGTLLAGYAAPASNHAGNALTGVVMNDSAAGHDDFIDPAAAALADGALDQTPEG